MKKVIGVLVLAIFALGLTTQSALADGTTITLNGIFTSDANGSDFSGPNEAFSISFNVPSTLTSVSFGGGFSVDTSILFSSTLTSPPIMVPAVTVVFNPSSEGGLFDLFFTTEEFSESATLNWILLGQQLYTLNSAGTTATLVPNGTFNISPSTSMTSGGSVMFDTFGDSAPIASGVVTLTSGMPEPSALYLLLCGLLALATLKRKFLSGGHPSARHRT
jgi:hypothetical protein